MSEILGLKHPESDCECYKNSGLEEEFLCELCLTRLRQERTKLKHKLRRESKKHHKEQ